MFKMGFKSLHTTTHAHRVLATALLTLLLAAVGTTAQAQRVGLKTNLLYWATATPNVGLEFRLNRHLTLDLDAAYNRLKVGDINLGGNVVMVGEMQMEYMLGSQFSGQRDRAMPQAMLGFEYAMRRPAHRDPITTPTQRNVVTASAGTSLFTGSYSQMSPFGRKLQMVTTLGYGRWLSGMHGVYGEVSNSVVQRRGKGNQNITSLTAAYMLDAKAAVTGLPTANDVFQTTAIVGPTIGISSRKNHDTKVTMGIHAALQAGWRVTDNLELYVEPSATVYSKKIEPYTPHPAEGELKLSVGAKVHF